MANFFRRDDRIGLYCVELRTSQWQEALDWYREALGLRVLVRQAEDGYALFEAGDTRLALIARESAGDASPRWSLGFEVDDLELAHKRLTAFGSEISRSGHSSEGFQELVTADPDGNTIRLFSWPKHT